MPSPQCRIAPRPRHQRQQPLASIPFSISIQVCRCGGNIWAAAHHARRPIRCVPDHAAAASLLFRWCNGPKVCAVFTSSTVSAITCTRIVWPRVLLDACNYRHRVAKCDTPRGAHTCTCSQVCACSKCQCGTDEDRIEIHSRSYTSHISILLKWNSKISRKS